MYIIRDAFYKASFSLNSYYFARVARSKDGLTAKVMPRNPLDFIHCGGPHRGALQVEIKWEHETVKHAKVSAMVYFNEARSFKFIDLLFTNFISFTVDPDSQPFINLFDKATLQLSTKIPINWEQTQRSL